MKVRVASGALLPRLSTTYTPSAPASAIALKNRHAVSTGERMLSTIQGTTRTVLALHVADAFSDCVDDHLLGQVAAEIGHRIGVIPFDDRADHFGAKIDVAVDRACQSPLSGGLHAGTFGDESCAHAHAAARLDHVAFLAECRVARHRDFADADRVEPLDQAEARIPVQLVADAVVAFA